MLYKNLFPKTSKKRNLKKKILGTFFSFGYNVTNYTAKPTIQHKNLKRAYKKYTLYKALAAEESYEKKNYI